MVRVYTQIIMALSLLIGSGAWAAPNEPETYSRLKLSVGGYYYSGNLNQLQANFQGHYGLSSPTAGVDVLFNGFRVWSKADQDSAYEVSGDDLYMTALPFYYVSDRFFVAGLGRFESSTSLKLKSRYLAGAGLGFAPVRSKDFLVRLSVIPTYEAATFDGEDFRIDVPHDGPDRAVFRAAVISNGWYRVKETPVTLRYFAQIWPNPVTLEDFRMNVNGSMDLRLIKELSFRLSVFVTHDAAILEGREPNDVRSTFGFAWSSQ